VDVRRPGQARDMLAVLELDVADLADARSLFDDPHPGAVATANS
jgi:hypothetical protein